MVMAIIAMTNPQGYAMWKERIEAGRRDERWSSLQWNEKDDSKLVRLRME